MIFGIGFHRTGTMTLDRCLQILGFDTVHYYMDKVYRKPAHVLTGEVDYRFFCTREAFTDNPTPYLFRELDERFAGSRFILTDRGTDSWLDSIEYLFTEGRNVYGWGEWEHALHYRLYGVRDSGLDKRRCRAAYEAHREAVRDHFSRRPQDLLVIDWSATKNWTALCAFLNRSPPAVAIPHEHRRPGNGRIRPAT